MVDEAGSGRWLGIRYPSRRAPLTAAQVRAANESRARAQQQAAQARARAERRALRAARASGCPAPSAPLVGLLNLGNTCFLSSAIQCLAHSRPLAAYFRAGLFARELNAQNPLGHGGQLAAAYAALLNQMWRAKCMDAIEPRKIKVAIGRFCPQFAGNQQHDAQELLSFLLDGLHEDLNRVRRKPYVALADSAGRPDGVVAREQWSAYRARDNSVIVDLYTGLLKSSLRFDQCGRVSTTFDPYTSLSLPLPKEKIKFMQITLVWQEHDQDKQEQTTGGTSGSAHGAVDGRRSERRGRAPTKYCIEFDTNAVSAPMAAATTTVHASSTTATPATSASASAASSVAASTASASSSSSAAGAASSAPSPSCSRPGLAASTRVLDVKAALGRLSGLDPSRVQLARLQLSSFDIWRRTQFNFLPNFYNISDFSLAMQSAAGPAGNQNDVYYAFELPEPPPPPPPTSTHSAGPYIAPSVVSATAVSAVPAGIGPTVPRFHTSPAVSNASASSPTLATAASSATAAAAPLFPTSYGGVTGTVTRGTKFDVKDSVHKWELATCIDIRILISVQAMRDMGGSLESVQTTVAPPMGGVLPAVPAVASVVETPQSPPTAASAAVPIAHSLRKHSSTDNCGVVRFSDEADPSAPHSPPSAGGADAAQPPLLGEAEGGTVVLTGSGDNEHIHFAGVDDESDDDEDVAPLSNGHVATASGAAQTHTDESLQRTADDGPERSATLAPSTTVQHGRDASLTVSSMASTLASSSTSASASSSYRGSSSTPARFSPGPSPLLVYQHVAEIPRKLPPSHPPVELLFSFDGFSRKWDEWVPITSPRIAPYGSGLTRTHGRNSVSHNANAANSGPNLNAAYLTGPPPAGAQFHNPQYSGHAAASASGFGYGSGVSDAEAGWVRIHCIQRCLRSTPNFATLAGAANRQKQRQQSPADPPSGSPPPGALAPDAASSGGVAAAASSSSSSSSSASPAPAPSASAEAASSTGAQRAPYDLQLFSIPLMLWLDPRRTTTAQLYDQLWRKVRRFTKLPDTLREEEEGSRYAIGLAHDQGAHNGQISDRGQQVDDASKGDAGNGQPLGPSAVPSPAAVPPPASLEVAASACASAATSATSSSVATPAAAAAAAAGVPSTSSRVPSARAPFASSAPSLPSYFFASATAPFQLRYSNHSGTQCSRCQTYNKSCIGCPIYLVNEEELLRQEEQEQATDASASTAGAVLPLLMRDTPLVSPSDRPAHVRSWHHDCTLVLDWNPDYALAGLIDVGEMCRLEVGQSVSSFRERVSGDQSASRVDLDVCFQLFTQTEKLSGDAAVYCSVCKKHEEATKTLELYSTPPLLVLHLKRLLPDTKLFTEVRFPLKGFDPKPFLAANNAHAAADNGPPSTYARAKCTMDKVDELERNDAAGGAGEEKKQSDPTTTAEAAGAPSQATRADDVKIDFASSDEQLVAHVHHVVRAVNAGQVGGRDDTVAAASPLGGQGSAPADAHGSSPPRPALRVEVTEAAAHATETPADAAVAPASQASHLAAPIAKRATATPSPSLGAVGASPSVSPSATPGPGLPAASPSPTPSAPPPVYTPVAGGFDASVSGLDAQAAAGSDGAPDLYDLYAVVNHFGAIGGGHYVTYALDRERGLWFRFDDGVVSRLDESKVVSASAYMLFYERRGLSASAGVDACPADIRAKKLDAHGRQLLRETNAAQDVCAPPCAIQ